jgi:ABC-type nickel/cobalt efflux system permease component RcnA
MRRGLILLGLPVGLGLLALWLTGGMAGLMAAVQGWQREAQEALAGAVRALRGGQPGAWATLLGVCFTYGVLHAAGPGHGKALIGAYGVARRVPVLRLGLLALVSALAQAAVAVALVYALVALLGLTRDAATGLAEGAVPALGNLLIAGLGLWLLWRGVQGLRRQATAAQHHRHHDHHHHDHDEACGCGHAHAPTVAQVQALTGWRDTALLVAGIAMRPCSGALFLLILTWQIGIGAAGIAGAFAMGLGVAAVTMAVAAMAVWAREGAFSALSGGGIARALPLVEALAGTLIATVALGLLWQAL